MKDIQEYCVIDCRVSDKQQLAGGGLDDQETVGRMVAGKRGWLIAKIFRKPHSATTTERDDFQEVLDFIAKDQRNIRGYIFKSFDRLTRMGSQEYWKLKEKLESVGVEVVDSTGIIQPKRNSLEHYGGNQSYKWSIYSPSEAAETAEANRSKSDVRDVLTRLVGAEIALVQDGYAVRRPPDGLKNKSIFVDGKKKIIREADPERFHFFQKMLELLADGMDYLEVTNRLNAMGFRTSSFNKWDRHDKEHPKIVGQKGGKSLTVKQLQRYILQTEYAGVSYEKWNKHHPVKTQQFDGLVPIDIFNRANRGKIYIRENADGSIDVLHNYSPWGRVKRLRDNPTYPWKCILCPLCQSEMVGSKSKRKYDAYHCGGYKAGKRAHKYLRIPKKEYEENISTFFDSLKFDNGFLEGLELRLIDKYRTREKEILVESSSISRNVSDLKAELAKKLDAFSLAQSQITREMLEKQIEGLDSQIKQTESERNEIEITEKSVRAFIRYAKYVMEHPGEILTKADNLHSRRALLGLFFEEIPTYHQILNGTPKLQPLFKLSEEFKIDKTQLVTLRGVEPRFYP